MRGRGRGGRRSHPLADWQNICLHRGSFPSSSIRTQIGPCRATLYHFEQKAARQQQSATCSRCLAQGHTVSICESDNVRRECQKPGHKRGDPACPLPATLPEVPDNAIQEMYPWTTPQTLIYPLRHLSHRAPSKSQTSGTRTPCRVM